MRGGALNEAIVVLNQRFMNYHVLTETVVAPQGFKANSDTPIPQDHWQSYQLVNSGVHWLTKVHSSYCQILVHVSIVYRKSKKQWVFLKIEDPSMQVGGFLFGFLLQQGSLYFPLNRQKCDVYNHQKGKLREPCKTPCQKEP